ncbi:MAG TPA: alpha/beta fold hydrolase [Myxococcota bacterium]|nr:alpha/beta fold hydrolase [Myxococcota bacterium]
MPEKYVQVDGIATFLRHVGPTTLPEKPPELSRGETVVCLHGQSANSGFFADTLERLAKAHSPLAFDFPGHARSGGLDPLGSIAALSRHTRGVLAALRVESCVLLGGAMGGMVALETALEAPALVRALVLVTSAAQVAVPDALVERWRLISEGKARREFERAGYAASASPDVMRRAFMEELKTDPRVVHQNWLAVRAFDRSRDLARVRCPTLVVVGDEDAQSRPSSDALAAGIPGARLALIPKCGTRVPLEQPDAFAEALLAFLAELPR